MRRLLLLPLLVSAAACGTEDGPRAAVATVDTLDGVEHWSYAAESAAALEWALDTVAVLGDAFASDEYQFDQVVDDGLAGDDEGALYVLDRQGARVLKYGPDGAHLATFGRKGEGPGELSQPLGVAVGTADTVWVIDFSTRRLTGYPQDGGEARVVPYPNQQVFPAPPLAVVDGGFIQSVRELRRFGPPELNSDDADVPRRIPLLRFDRSLQPVDTLWSIPEPPTDMVRLEIGDGMIMMMMAREFTPAFEWRAFSDGTVVISDTAAYLLRFVAPAGEVRRVIARDPAPRAVTEEDRERVRQRLRDEEEGGMGVRIGGSGPDEDTRKRMLEERLSKMTFAEVVPRVLALRVDPLDRLWVGVTEEVADSIARIDVYERDGTLVGELRGFPMPDVFIGTDRIGVLRRDEMDVQQIVVMRVRQGDEPTETTVASP